jgi:hypothetical protein
MTDRVSILEKIQNEARELFKKKNQDYGDAFANYGAIGVLVRIGDKISRLQSITTRQISLINTESLRDTLIDLHNYSAMAIMLIDEKKPIETLKYPTPVSSPENSPDKFQKDVSVANNTGNSSKSPTLFLNNVTIEDLM